MWRQTRNGSERLGSPEKKIVEHGKKESGKQSPYGAGKKQTGFPTASGVGLGGRDLEREGVISKKESKTKRAATRHASMNGREAHPFGLSSRQRM